jgi:type II secretory pathway pseudopilin PulG
LIKSLVHHPTALYKLGWFHHLSPGVRARVVMSSTDRQSHTFAASSAGFPIAAYLAAMVVLASGAAAMLDRTVTSVVTAQGLTGNGLAANAVLAKTEAARSSKPTIVTQAYSVVLNDDFNERIRSRQYWSDRKSGRGSGGPDPSYRGGGNRSGLGGGQGFLAALFGPSQPVYRPDQGSRTDGADWYRGNGGTYATVCVRLCDGYAFPISFSTLPTYFERDEKLCEQRCAAPTELYYYQNPGGAQEQMVSYRSRQPITALKTANRFRKEYVQGCSCKPAEYVASAVTPDRRVDPQAPAPQPPKR